MTNKTPSMLPSPREMVEHLDLFVRGQARAKWDLSSAVYSHYISQAYHGRSGMDLGNNHVLMLGPTGVGKTYMVKLLSKFLGIPVGFSSATDLVEAGYKGDSVESLVKTLLDRSGGDPRKAERGIIFIDEVDKIHRAPGSGFRDVGGEGVQNALLTLLDGRDSKGMEGNSHPTVDTSRVLVICTGAFVGLDNMIQNRLGHQARSIGFCHGPNEEDDTPSEQPIYDALCQVETSDLVQFGLIPELIGRFTTLTAVHELTRKHLREIMGEDIQHSALQCKKRLALIHGIELDFTDDGLDAIAQQALAKGTGARGLRTLVGRAVSAVDGRWPELANDGYTRVVINRACVEGASGPQLEVSDAVQERIDGELRLESFQGTPASPSEVCGGSIGNVTNTRGWTNESLREAIERTKVDSLDWNQTTGSAKKWFLAFENEHKGRLSLVYRLVEELRNRNATVTEFFLAYVYSNTDNIQGNILYMEYLRLKREEEEKKKEQSQQARENIAKEETKSSEDVEEENEEADLVDGEDSSLDDEPGPLPEGPAGTSF